MMSIMVRYTVSVTCILVLFSIGDAVRYSLKSSVRHGRFIVCISFFLQIPSLLSGKMNPVRHRGRPPAE